jgi:hypothetical protein
MKSFLYAAAVIAGTFAVVGNAFAWASLAIDSNQGSAYGVSYDQSDAATADARALQECGQGCRVVKHFASGCGAYAADQAYGGTAYGWGTDQTEAGAKSIALNACQQYGGKECIVRAWSCNSH